MKENLHVQFWSKDKKINYDNQISHMNKLSSRKNEFNPKILIWIVDFYFTL